MNDVYFMRLAIEEAKKAYNELETIGIGALVVKNMEVISSAHNTTKKDIDPTAHAEINAIRLASKKLKTKSLESCVLYSTCEPCQMCFTAAWWAKIPKIVYGTKLSDFLEAGHKVILLGCEIINKLGNYGIEIKGEFLRNECLELYKLKKV